MKLWLSIAFFVASFTVLMYGQERPKQPLLSPAQAAAVLLGPAMQSNRTNPQPALPKAPPSIVIASTPGAATWLPMPKPSETRRLDGTSIDTPPANYGGTSVIVVATPGR